MLFFEMHHVNEGLPITLKNNRDFICHVTFAPPEIQGISQANWIPLPNNLNSLPSYTEQTNCDPIIMKITSLWMLFFEMHHVNEGLPITLKKNRDFMSCNFCAPRNSRHIASELGSATQQPE